jgi:hypothetical protein
MQVPLKCIPKCTTQHMFSGNWKSVQLTEFMVPLKWWSTRVVCECFHHWRGAWRRYGRWPDGIRCANLDQPMPNQILGDIEIFDTSRFCREHPCSTKSVNICEQAKAWCRESLFIVVSAISRAPQITALGSAEDQHIFVDKFCNGEVRLTKKFHSFHGGFVAVGPLG